MEAVKDHRRSWENFNYVYPVISRRSKGVSIGINLNPDKVCNFDCVYCEVDRKIPSAGKNLSLASLASELVTMLKLWQTGSLFKTEPFASVPQEWRDLKDIAFSGDGEPTTCPVFPEVVHIASEIRSEFGCPDVKLVLITNATCLERASVKKGIQLMQKGPYEIWAKLDAGTEKYYKQVNRSFVHFERILQNISETAQWCPLMIQSLFFRMRGKPPPKEEIFAYCDQLRTIQKAGGKILKLHLYTIARPTTESWATALSNEELDRIASVIRTRVNIPQELAYAPE
ncbi:MAG: radical SAM protein [Verrucomicrobiota bacterium]